MGIFPRPPGLIVREPVRVMSATCADEPLAIQELWLRFEELVGLRGRRMYAVVDLAAGTYATCTPLRPDDEPAALGLHVGELPGGRFLRGRLLGEPPELYSRIGPAFDELESRCAMDRSRPLVEFYTRRDRLELWLPVAG